MSECWHDEVESSMGVKCDAYGTRSILQKVTQYQRNDCKWELFAFHSMDILEPLRSMSAPNHSV